ncbi:39S ribosomal protein L22, mitochondrial [Fopius arisanus]|uniref:Large ribosomal subunit protein uL22m n=1 Tax=Fopius arisanus TaxID=64838 RepID=A0A0C9RED5_9HYME|nr:PREDICTED: 39S ribosomal protein L22, mitochondrial [Fopius arisanus]XP_011296934.1 PREDICTED: 39S ribosomal protein L22, mitochondrial [Fopius arisanus]
MQSLRRCIQTLTSTCKFNGNNVPFVRTITPASTIHTTSSRFFEEEDHERDYEGPKHWMDYNKKVYPPQEPGEPRRPAFVCNVKANIKYSPKTMWYIASFVRGLTVDEAVRQLSFCLKKGAVAAKETILEAQRMAVEEHNVEFKSNLWVAESFATKGKVVHGIRKHAKSRIGRITYRYVHYYVRLEEGVPPKDYYMRNPKTPEELLDNYLERMRYRKIGNTL